ncbi:MAG: imidazole glycerol phosphate synthase subunit HisH [Actinomycetota bacterium]|nr:imidazole glycerol phosphate synthase subunit HisH [Actinomycetota bacterium]
MIAIIDYGMGNLRSVQKGFEKVGVDAVIADEPAAVARAQGVVLPGVGAFVDAIGHLRESGLDRAVLDAIAGGKPFLGICLGLQLLFEKSYEDGEHTGLGVFAGTVERISADVKIPHMGWNQVKQVRESPLFHNVPDGADFYFVHSYVAKPADASVILATTDYGGDFASGVARDNVWAFQFHPEKSGLIGLQILRNFGAL